MSDHDEFPTFSGPADPREEALWQAYQAMLRRRNDPRARPPGPAAAVVAPPLASRPPPPSPTRPSRAEAQPANVPAPRAQPGSGWGRRATVGTAVALVAGALLAVGLWPRPAARPGATEAAQAQRVIPGSPHPAFATASRPTLPCFVDGQPVGRFTLDDCAGRGGVASGSLEVGAVARPAPVRISSPALAEQRPGPAHGPPLRGAGASVPLAAATPSRFTGIVPEGGRPLRHPSSPDGVFAEASPILAPAPARASPPAPGPQLDLVEPAPRQLFGDEVGRRPIVQVPARRASALAVREFYDALGEGDGARAAAVVIPEKRDDGPLSSRELTRFYSSLRAPLRLTQVDPINDNTVFVRYQFVTPDNRLCSGSATVETIHRDGDTLVRDIHAFNGC
jgi:hypothetical protein